LFVLHYDLDSWAVRTVLLVPHFAFALSAVERRKPLAPTARRAGWVGCNILLDKIPVHARISVVSEGTPQTSQQVRASYNRLRPLEKLQIEKRGWTLDVLQVVQSLGKLEFTLADVYAHAAALAKLHPSSIPFSSFCFLVSSFSVNAAGRQHSGVFLLLDALQP